MRKTGSILMTMLLLVFGAMLMAANMALAPLKEDAGHAKDLTAALRNRSLLAADTKVRLRSLRGAEDRLAEEGRGMLVELTPGIEVLTTPKRLGRLADVVCRLTLQQVGSRRRMDWLEIVLLIEGAEPLRTLMVPDADGRWAVGKSPFPDRYVPGARPQPPRPRTRAPVQPIAGG